MRPRLGRRRRRRLESNYGRRLNVLEKHRPAVVDILARLAAAQSSLTLLTSQALPQ